MAQFRQVFKNRNFTFLWLGQVISQFADRMNQLILIALVHQKAPGSAFQLAKLLSFTIVPAFLIAPIAGAYVDRWNKKHTMIASSIIRALLVLSIPLVVFSTSKLWLIYILVFVIFSLSAFFLPARLAIVPDVVEKKDLLIANSVFTTTGMIAGMMAFAASGFLIEFLGGVKSSFVNAGIYFFSALAIAMVVVVTEASKKDSAPFGEVLQRSLFAEIKEGFSYLVNHQEVRFIIRALFALMAGAGALYAVLVVFIQQTLGSVTRDIGIFSFLAGIGFFIGSLIYGRFGQRISKERIISVCLVITGGLITALALVLKFYQSIYAAGGLIVLFGIFVAPIAVSASTVVHEVSHQDMRGRVFSSIGIIMNFSLLLFMLLASRLADFIDHAWILIGTSMLFIFFGLLGGNKKCATN